MVNEIVNVIPPSAFKVFVTAVFVLFVVFGDIYLIKLTLDIWRGLTTGEGMGRQMSRMGLVLWLLFFAIGTVLANAWVIYIMVLGGKV